MKKPEKLDSKIHFDSLEEMPLPAMSLGSMLSNKTGSWRNMKPVINYDNCIKCMICWKYCPDTCIDIKDEAPVINYDYCKGCGVCAEECPKKTITLVEDVK